MSRLLPPDPELRELVREHGSFMAVGRVLGVSHYTVGNRCRQIGVRSPNRRGGRRHCDRCAVSSEDRLIMRFGLSVTTRVNDQSKCGRISTRGAGTFYLCEPCWSETAKSRLHSRRRPHLRAVA